MESKILSFCIVGKTCYASAIWQFGPLFVTSFTKRLLSSLFSGTMRVNWFKVKFSRYSLEVFAMNTTLRSSGQYQEKRSRRWTFALTIWSNWFWCFSIIRKETALDMSLARNIDTRFRILTYKMEKWWSWTCCHKSTSTNTVKYSCANSWFVAMELFIF